MTQVQTLTPKDLLDLARTGLVPVGPVSADTETSGLHPDDNARIAVVSVAWEDPTGQWVGYPGVTWRIEDYYLGEDEDDVKSAAIVSVAWAFDQGVVNTGKPEDNGQMALFEDAPNLDADQYQALLDWLDLVAGTARVDPNLVMQNAKFDVTMFNAGVRRWPDLTIDLRGRILWDTQVASDLIYPEHPTSLKPTAARLFGTETNDESARVQAYLKKAKLPAGRWDLVPWDIIGPYADQDARITLMLYLRQRHDIDSGTVGRWVKGKTPTPGGKTQDPQHESVYAYMRRRMAVMSLLTDMEWRGIPYDEIASREAAIECRDRAKPLSDKLPYEPTINAAKDYYFGKGKTKRGVECLDLPPYEVTEKGAPAMTKEITERMEADNLPHIQTFAQMRKAESAASMWYEGYADRMGPDGRLRTVFRQNGTVSTRFSVERVNLQAIPQDYRLTGFSILEGIPTPRRLIAKAVKEGMPGWKLWELDLEQAELRVAAQFAGCKTMLRMIDEGSDLHTYTTLELFARSLPGGVDDPNFGPFRQVGKRGNFSLIFGSGGDTFRKMVSKETGIRLEEPQANMIVRDWNRLYPEFKYAIDLHMDKVIRRQNRHGIGWIDLINGERRWFKKHEDAHKAFNQRVQPNLAQFGIDWMLETDKIMRWEKISERGVAAGIGGAGLLLTIHDSQVLLLPDTDEGDELAQAAADAGRALWKKWFDVPGGVDAKVWSK